MVSDSIECEALDCHSFPRRTCLSLCFIHPGPVRCAAIKKRQRQSIHPIAEVEIRPSLRQRNRPVSGRVQSQKTMIEYTQGNLLEADVEAVVNTVNTGG